MRHLILARRAAIVAAAAVVLSTLAPAAEASAATAAVAPAVARVERVTNPTFDVSTLGWKATSGSIVTWTAAGREGGAARVTRLAGGTSMLADAADVSDVVLGARCHVSVELKAPPGRALRLRVREYLGSAVAADLVASAVATGAWQTLGVDRVTTGGSLDLSAYALSMAATDDLLVDDFSVACLDPDVAMYDAFDRPDGLVTNEYAKWNPNSPARVESPLWDMTSGSLFAEDGAGWTGTPDGGSPDAMSTSATGSAVFRLNTKDASFSNVDVAMRLRVDRFVSTSRTPVVDWDGVHIWLRYKSEEQLYYASVNRRDGTVVIKKKCPGGPSNGGTYYTLASKSGFAVPLGVWQDVAAGVVDNPDGSVTLRLWREGVLRIEVTDRGIGCSTLTGAGAVGIRGDNADFQFDDFTVHSG